MHGEHVVDGCDTFALETRPPPLCGSGMRVLNPLIVRHVIAEDGGRDLALEHHLVEFLAGRAELTVRRIIVLGKMRFVDRQPGDLVQSTPYSCCRMPRTQSPVVWA